MSKPSRRPNREEIKRQRKEARNADKQLRQRMKEKGLVVPAGFSVSNRKSQYKTVEEETQARQEAVTEEAKVLKANLPVLLKRLSKIPDPRNPKKIKHKLTVLMLYGILVFVYQMASRRQANEKMTNPIIIENLKLLENSEKNTGHLD